MRAAICILIVLLGASCGNKTGISKELSGSDSLVVMFNAPGSDSITGMVSTTEKKAIRKLAGFLDGKKSELYKCGYDGNLVFYKDGQEIMAAVFKFSEEGCRHFVFNMDDTLTSTSMSHEAADFLRSLQQGRNWY